MVVVVSCHIAECLVSLRDDVEPRRFLATIPACLLQFRTNVTRSEKDDHFDSQLVFVTRTFEVHLQAVVAAIIIKIRQEILDMVIEEMTT